METFGDHLCHNRAIFVANLVDFIGVFLIENPEAVRGALQPVRHLARRQKGLFQPL
jgi:hypothetical protein